MPPQVKETGPSTPAKTTRSKVKGSQNAVKTPSEIKPTPKKKSAKSKAAKEQPQPVLNEESIDDAIVLNTTALPSTAPTEAAPIPVAEDTTISKEHKTRSKKNQIVRKDGLGHEKKAVSKKASKKGEKSGKIVPRKVSEIPKWKLSPSHGGRFLPIDPVFSNDEQFVFIAVPNSLKVYSTKTSLFVRSFDIPGVSDDIALDSDSRIVSYAIDPLDGNQIFIANYSGHIFLWNWAIGQLLASWSTSTNIQLLRVSPGEEEISTHVDETAPYTIPITGRVVYLVSRPSKAQSKAIPVAQKGIIEQPTEVNKLTKSSNTEPTPKTEHTQKPVTKMSGEYEWYIYRATLLPPGADGDVELLALHGLKHPVVAFRVVGRGEVVVAISGSILWIGNKKEEDATGSWGEWRSVYMKNQTSCLDVKLFGEGKGKKGKNSEKKLNGLIVVGDVSGAIYLWKNILGAGSGDQPGAIRRMHWHRGCVGSAKISEDGNYIISGGNETVLVLWQIDTGFKQFLPHITSAIESIVVSPSGASYAVRLADNSVMVLSTTELKPKANIAGFQSATIPIRFANQPDTSLIKTVDNIKIQSQKLTCPRVQCAVHPTKPNQLLVATSSHSTSTIILAGNKQVTEPAPYLQTYDISTDRAVTKQALARTLASDLKIGPAGNTLVEPTVSLLGISDSGDWLATIDEWSPPANDLIESMDKQLIDGREVYLKFWRRDEKNGWDLATRVDSPHPSPVCGMLGGGAKVFDLISLPSPSVKKIPVFASLGADGCVRIWKARVRTRKGGEKVTLGGAEQVNWNCRRVIQFAKNTPELAHGAMAVSQDGSAIAVAISAPSQDSRFSVESSTIYILSPESNVIHHTFLGIRAGIISSLKITDRYLVILGTRKLVVFDLPMGVVKWEIPMQVLTGDRLLKLDPEQLFLDASASPGGGVIVGINVPPTKTAKEPTAEGETEKKTQEAARHTATMFIFDPTSSPNPLYMHTLPKNVGLTAVKALSTSGYIYLDTFSRIKTLVPAHHHHHDQHLAALATPPTELTTTITTPQGLSAMYQAASLTAGGDEGDDKEQKEEANSRPPVAPEVLSNVFFSEMDSSAAYSVMEMGDVFERVLGLFARPPLEEDVAADGQRSGGDEMEID